MKTQLTTMVIMTVTLNIVCLVKENITIDKQKQTLSMLHQNQVISVFKIIIHEINIGLHYRKNEK